MRVIATILAVYTLLGGMISFVGWALDIRGLTDWNGVGVSIQPNSCIAAIASGAAVLLISQSRCRIAIPFALIVTGIGLTSVYQLVSGGELHEFNTFLMFNREWGISGTVFQGRIGTPGSVSWSLIGVALIVISLFHGNLLSPRFLKVRIIAVMMMILTMTISMLSLTGYLYGATSLYTLPSLTTIAIQTASFIFAVSMATILIVPDVGPMRFIADQGPAGIMVRRVFPAIFGVPIILGLIRLAGERAGYYDLAFGTAARTLVEIFLLLALLAWTAQTVRRQTRRAEEQELLQRHAQEDQDLLFTIAEKIRAIRKPDELLADISDTVGRYLGVHRCLFNEIDIDRDLETVHGDYSRTGDYVSGEHKISDYSQISSESMRLGHTVVNRNSQSDPRTAELFDRIYGPNKEISYVTVPMLRDGRWVASFWCSDDKPRDWTDQEVALLENVAERTWAAVERVRSEKALRESEERYRALFDSMDEGYVLVEVIFDKEDTPVDILYLEANRAAMRMSGTELVGRLLSEIAPNIEPHWVETFGRVAKTGIGERHELPAEPLNAWYNFFAFKVGDSGDRKVAAVYEDVTQRRKAVEDLRENERRFKLAQEAGSVGIWDWDIPAGRTYWSDQMWTLYDEERQDINPDVEFWSSHLHEDDRARAAAKFNNSLNSGTEHHNDNFRLVKKDGAVRWIESIATIERGIDGVATRMYGVNLDITELQKAREELEARVVERTQELAEANSLLLRQMEERAFIEEQRVQLLKRLFTIQEDERGRIARDIHDHLGQRLTALRLKIASVRDICGDDPTLIERVNKLQEISELLDKEVSFLAWELRPDTLDKTDFLHALEQYVREWSRYSNIFAEFDVIGAKDVRLDRDIENNLYRITQEALNNAAKYANAQQINVLLEKRGEHLILIVEDNGVGFDVSAVHNNGRGRRSLGLIGMKERASLIGGNIEVESSRGKGTTVFVNVPLNDKTNGRV